MGGKGLVFDVLHQQVFFFFFNIGKLNFMCSVSPFKLSVTWDSQELNRLEIDLTFLNITISAVRVYIKV